MSCTSMQPRMGKCAPPPNVSPTATLEDLVRYYKEHHDLHRQWDKECSIPEAVFGGSKVHPHQARIPKARLKEIADFLANHWNRDSFKDFEDLYEYVRSLLVQTPTNPNGIVKNPHALIIYDIALRLAYKYGVWPEKYVYLNGSGPYEAAKALGLGKFIKQRKILYEDIIRNYPELAALDAAQLEDFLCIFHNRLNNLKKKVII